MSTVVASRKDIRQTSIGITNHKHTRILFGSANHESARPASITVTNHKGSRTVSIGVVYHKDTRPTTIFVTNQHDTTLRSIGAANYNENKI